jgi:hypothetical protein
MGSGGQEMTISLSEIEDQQLDRLFVLAKRRVPSSARESYNQFALRVLKIRPQ